VVLAPCLARAITLKPGKSRERPTLRDLGDLLKFEVSVAKANNSRLFLILLLFLSKTKMKFILFLLPIAKCTQILIGHFSLLVLKLFLRYIGFAFGFSFKIFLRIFLRVLIEKSTNILPHDNSKTSYSVFVILIKPTIQSYEWSVFRLDSVVEISLDKSRTLFPTQD